MFLLTTTVLLLPGRALLSMYMYILFIQVVSDGYFSFGATPYVASRTAPFSTSYYPTYLVAPFWSDTDTSAGRSGKVFYEVFDSAMTSSRMNLELVSSFITQQTGMEFSGTWMLLAEWSKVQQHHGNYDLVSTLCYLYIY